MSDLISREDLIESLQERYKIYTWDDGGVEKSECASIIREVMRFPSAERVGHWIEDDVTWYKTWCKALNARGYFVDEHTPYFVDDVACSECLKKFSVIDNETERWNYCPNCGARMVSE